MRRDSKGKEANLGHAGQIITTRESIIGFIWDNEIPVAYNTLYLIAEYLNGRRHDVRLYSICSRLYYLSKLVYWGKKGVCKLTAEEYKKGLFDPHAENFREICDALASVDKNYSNLDMREYKDFFQDLIWSFMLIKDLWCKNIACLYEQVYIPELAYAFEYIVERKGDLPWPDIEGNSSLFPGNYENYNYTEGIAERFQEEMISMF